MASQDQNTAFGSDTTPATPTIPRPIGTADDHHRAPASAAEAEELFRRPPHDFIDVGSAEVAYRRVGTGPDVLFVHGWPVHSATFRGLLPYLAPHVTCHLIDLPGAGQSRFDARSPISLPFSMAAIRRVVDRLGLDSVALVGHDSGGLLARHSMVGDPRLRALGLINTEQAQGLTWRFRLFLVARHAPAFGATLAWSVGQRRLRRNQLLLGRVFTDSSFLDGAFDEFFLQPLATRDDLQRATVDLLRSFDARYVWSLRDLHPKIDVPVQLVWGRDDPFFPLAWAEEMATEFPDGRLAVVDDAGLFSHEERPAEVAAALLPVLR